MIRSLPLVLALGLAGLIGLVMLAGRTVTNPDSFVLSFTRAHPPNSFARTRSASKPIPITAEAGKSRNVGNGVVAMPLLGEGPLERVASLPQPTPPAAPNIEPTVPAKQSLRWRLVFNAVATSAGILQIGDSALVIPGIDVVAVGETCVTPTGSNWPCGMVARTAFRNYLQGRALNCHLPERIRDKAIVTECLLQGQDPAVWLVEHGWARSNADAALASIGEAAKASKRGIYGQPPVGIEMTSP